MAVFKERTIENGRDAMSSEVSGGFSLIPRLIHHQNYTALAHTHFDKSVVENKHQENYLADKRHITHAGLNSAKLQAHKQ